MGFDTELIFNEIELDGESLIQLRDSARDVLLDKDCPWSYMLKYIYIVSSDDRAIDLQVSKAMWKELTKLNGTRPMPFTELGETEPGDDGEQEEDPDYRLAWHPYDGKSGKWNDVDDFVAWICAFCTAGQLFVLTQEEGGGLWGWEFHEGLFRELELRSKGRWRRSRAGKAS